jgi:uncharacterized protein (UPF0332 family)
MAFAQDLLEQARHLLNRDRTRPRQVNLRRAISNAYYALFHLLSNAVAANWRQPGQRHDFARLLQHGQMRQVCDAMRKNRDQTITGRRLGSVCSAFVELQQLRHAADYDGSRTWSKSQAKGAIELAREPVAQDFLLSLLTRDRR